MYKKKLQRMSKLCNTASSVFCFKHNDLPAKLAWTRHGRATPHLLIFKDAAC